MKNFINRLGSATGHNAMLCHMAVDEIKSLRRKLEYSNDALTKADRQLVKSDKLHTYVHSGGGHWIGSCIIVQVENLELARRLIRKELDRQGLPNEELNIKRHPKHEKIVYVNNGDY